MQYLRLQKKSKTLNFSSSFVPFSYDCHARDRGDSPAKESINAVTWQGIYALRVS